MMPGERSLCSTADIARWTAAWAPLRRACLSCERRGRSGRLRDGEAPAGGRWTFDAERRTPAKADPFRRGRLRSRPSVRAHPRRRSRSWPELGQLTTMSAIDGHAMERRRCVRRATVTTSSRDRRTPVVYKRSTRSIVTSLSVVARIETALALSRSREGGGAAIVQTLEDVIEARLDLHMGIMVHRNVQAGSI